MFTFMDIFDMIIDDRKYFIIKGKDIVRKYAYGRVSSVDQNPDRQKEEFLALGIEEKLIFIDKRSGKDFQRPEYQLLKRFIDKGDMLYIKSLDRFGRNKQQILDEWKELTQDRGVDIVVLDMPLLDTTRLKELNGLETLIRDIVLQILSWMAEDERKRIRERQAEGIAIAKSKGKHLGRPKAKLPENFKAFYDQWKAGQITARKCMSLLDLKRGTFYKLVKIHESSII